MSRFIKIGNVIYNVETIYKIIFDDKIRSITVVYTNQFDDYKYQSDKNTYTDELYQHHKRNLISKLNGVDV